MKPFYLTLVLSTLGLSFIADVAALPISEPRSVASSTEGPALSTHPSTQILRREEEFLASRTWDAVKNLLPKKKELTDEEKARKLFKLQHKQNKAMIKHAAAQNKVEHDIGSKVIVESYRGDSADRAMAEKKAQEEWKHDRRHKFVDITVTEQTHKKTIMMVFHNGPGTPKTVPIYTFVHDR